MIPYLIERYKRGQYPFDKLIKVYDFEDFEEALNDMKTGVVFKPVLKW